MSAITSEPVFGDSVKPGLRRSRGWRSESGATLVLGIFSLVFIIPMVGLTVDAAVLYVVRSQLQAAVDGAALAAARALNLGANANVQATSGKQNAVNWFYANFPAGSWASSNTVLSTSNVTVADDPNNAYLRTVTIAATTSAPTYFMRWFGVNSVTVAATGTASRRDVVIMMVLDRSGSMCKPGAAPCSGSSATPCGAMITAAKQFAGQFAPGRDRIGLVSYSDGTYIHSAPTTDFQTVLGYTNSSGTGTGELDTISCGGGTGTAEAMTLAYHLLYQTNLPGALNVLLLETDGLPNTLTLNFWDATNGVAGIASGSGCRDRNNATISGGGFRSLSALPSWAPGLNVTQSPFLSSHPFLSNISDTNNLVGTVVSSDPDGADRFWNMLNYWTTFTPNVQSRGTATYPYNSSTGSGTPSLMSSTVAPGCSFAGTGGWYVSNPSDIAWWPATDAFGNALNPSGYTYQTVTLATQGHLSQNGWDNYHNGVMNATENSAYRARSNAILPATVCAIGLGGNSTSGPPDPVLLQRMANDPNADLFNYPPQYVSCSAATNCATFSSQPQGTFVYAPDSSMLGQAFQRIASQMLRLSK